VTRKQKVAEAKEILAAFGMPAKQKNLRSALTLLALAEVRSSGSWADSKQPFLRTVDIMDFMRLEYDKNYKPNSRETIRRQTLHQFEQARLVDRNRDDPARPTNAGNNNYSLTDEALAVIKAHGTPRFDAAVSDFLKQFGALEKAYAKLRDAHQVPLALPDGSTVFLSPGAHNELQVAIIKELGPRFVPGATIVYVGDTAKKNIVCQTQLLTELGVSMTFHDKLPDVVLYWREKNWLVLVEAVTSHGPVSPKRYAEIEGMLASCSADRVYITAFLDPKGFRKYAGDIAWETEVWMASDPDHMIHFNGPKFLGPYPKGGSVA